MNRPFNGDTTQARGTLRAGTWPNNSRDIFKLIAVSVWYRRVFKKTKIIAEVFFGQRVLPFISRWLAMVITDLVYLGLVGCPNF